MGAHPVRRARRIDIGPATSHQDMPVTDAQEGKRGIHGRIDARDQAANVFLLVQHMTRLPRFAVSERRQATPHFVQSVADAPPAASGTSTRRWGTAVRLLALGSRVRLGDLARSFTSRR